MTTSSVTIMADQDTTANFRSGGSAFAGQLSAMGLVQTSDTGQINWTTVNRNTTGDGLAGYEIWKFNDTLQATVPVFIRVEYRCGSGSTNRWQVWISVGFATDGAGNLTGTQKTTSTRCQSSSDATLYGSATCLFSGSTNRIAAAAWPGVAGSTISMFFLVERSKDNNGADTGDGVHIFLACGGTGVTHVKSWQYLPFTGGVPTAEPQATAILTNNSSSVFGTTIHMGVPIPIAGSMMNPGIGFLVYTTADYARDTTVSQTIYGASHTYYTLGPNWQFVAGCGGFATLSANGVNSRIAFLYE